MGRDAVASGKRFDAACRPRSAALKGRAGRGVRGVVGLLAREVVSSADRWPMAMIYLGDVIAARAEALSFQDGYLALAVAFGLATLCALSLARNRPIGTEA